MDNMICPNPNCGYRGEPEKQAKGSWEVAVLLLILGIIPGLIYAGVMSGHKYTCPNCKIEVGSD